MSKKHFIALADMIRAHNKFASDPFTKTQINELAGFCKRHNPNFDWDRWLDYIDGKCGPSGGAVKKAAA
jgi:hypothetical protein